jgi:glutathione S-transferase
MMNATRFATTDAKAANEAANQAAQRITLFYAPHSRATTARILLDELGAQYRMHVLDLKKGEQRQQDYLSVNPMGKVPAILHGDTLVTEQAAVYLYLADLYPEAGLAPAIGDPLRGEYLRWMVFFGSCLEPAITDSALKREPAQPSLCPYGDIGTMLATVTDHLQRGPYLLGERFSAADLLWGASLHWILAFQLLEENPVLRAYTDRICGRPIVKAAFAADETMAAELAA